MSTAIVTLISVAVMLSGVSIIAGGSLKSVDILSNAWKEMEARSGEMSRTKVEVVTTSHAPPLVDATLRNSGQVSLRDFASWDVMVQYYEADGTYHQLWVPYTATTPSADEWTVTGLFLDAAASSPELFQPGILDPEEEMVIRVNLSPAADGGSTHALTVGTPNGVTVSTTF